MNQSTIRIKRTRKGEYYAVLYGKNHKMIWRTSESYKRLRTVERAIEILRSFNGPTIPNSKH